MCMYSVKEIVGYEPEELLGDDMNDDHFVHPADLKSLVPSRQFCKRLNAIIT